MNIIRVIIVIVCFVILIIFVIRILYHQQLNNQLTLMYPKSNNILYPSTVRDIKDIIKKKVKISICGAGKSMGGQTFGYNSIQINMDRFNRIKHFDNDAIVVESGCKWDEIIKKISPYGYSIAAMQSYCDFSVGGSISVNCHGQDLVNNPICNSIIEIKLITINGKTLILKPNDRLFSYVVGGYGLMGIIIEATLKLTNNIRMNKSVVIKKTEHYLEHLSNTDARNTYFHSARLDLNPDNLFKKCLIIDYNIVSDDSVNELLHKEQVGVITDGLYLGIMSNYPELTGSRLNIEYNNERKIKTITRNKLLFSTIDTLDSFIYPTANYILQEYFIPCKNLYRFLDTLKSTITKNRVNLLNVTLRYVRAHETVLSYSKNNTIALVLYIDLDKKKSLNYNKIWTKEIINNAIECEGCFYLPYHLWVDKQQLISCYPLIEHFISKKKQYDPNNLITSNFYENLLKIL